MSKARIKYSNLIFSLLRKGCVILSSYDKIFFTSVLQCKAVIERSHFLTLRERDVAFF